MYAFPSFTRNIYICMLYGCSILIPEHFISRNYDNSVWVKSVNLWIYIRWIWYYIGCIYYISICDLKDGRGEEQQWRTGIWYAVWTYGEKRKSNWFYFLVWICFNFFLVSYGAPCCMRVCLISILLNVDSNTYIYIIYAYDIWRFHYFFVNLLF